MAEKNRLYSGHFGSAWSKGTCLVLSILGGVLGGFVERTVFRPSIILAEQPSVLKSRGIEFTDSFGKRVGFLGSNDSGDVSLVFFDQQGTKRAELGLSGGTTPVLAFHGVKGSSLMSIDLGRSGKPRLIMSDPDFNGRVLLGVNEPDAPAEKADYDAWVLMFQGDRRSRVTVGMRTGGIAGIMLRDKDGNEWWAPLKPVPR